MFLKKILIGVGVLTILGAMLSSVTSCPITVKVDSDKAPNNTFTAQESVAQLNFGSARYRNRRPFGDGCNRPLLCG